MLSILPSVALGTRLYARRDGSGFFLGVNLAGDWHEGALFDTDQHARHNYLYVATLTPGYRFAWDTFFLQAAVGGGLAYNFRTWDTSPPTKDLGAIPDAGLAAGFRF